MAMEVGAAGTIMPPVEAVLKTAQRNERAGYDSLWWPDHWMAWHPESIWTPDVTPIAQFQPTPHVYLDPVACMAAVAVQTKTVRLGTAVVEAIRRHPSLLAHEWLTLDHLSKGRAILGIGAGEAENNTPYGIPFRKPVSQLEEALEIVRLLWENDDPVDFDGEFWTLRSAVCGMGPYEGKFPEIWVGANGPRMLDITGRLADGWMPTQLLSHERWAASYGRVREAAEKAGRDPDAITPVVYALMVIAEDHDTAHRLMEDRILRGFTLVLASEVYERHGAPHPLGGAGYHGITDYIPTHFDRDTALAAIDAIPDGVVHDFFLHGTPDEILANLREYERLGARHAILWNVSFIGDLARIKPSFDLTDEIMRALKSDA